MLVKNDSAFTNTAGSGCFSSTLVTKPDKAKYLSCFTHGNSLFRHNALLCIDYKDYIYRVKLPRDYTLILHWPDCIGIVDAIESECRPDSRRNGVRYHAGMADGLGRNTQFRYQFSGCG